MTTIVNIGQGAENVSPAHSTEYIEQLFIARWAEALKVENIKNDDNFFELGGHSLLIATIFAPLEEELSIEIATGVMFDKPTIKELAEHVQMIIYSKTNQKQTTTVDTEKEMLEVEI